MQRFRYCAAPLLLGLLIACGEPLAGPELVVVPAGLARYHLPGSSDVQEEALQEFSIMGLYAGIPEISVSPAPVPPRAHPGR